MLEIGKCTDLILKKKKKLWILQKQGTTHQTKKLELHEDTQSALFLEHINKESTWQHDRARHSQHNTSPVPQLPKPSTVIVR